jgi:hypothetical protein
MTGKRRLPTLELYDIAYLAGGPQRVAEAALIRLRDRGVVTVVGPRVRARRGEDGRADHPVERALVAQCSRGGKSVTFVLAALRNGPEVEAIRRRLVSHGLLTRYRRRPTRAGRRQLAAARRDGMTLPGYVLDGTAAVTDRRLRRTIGNAAPPPSGLGRTLIRMGKRLDNDHDSNAASDSASGGYADGGGGGGGGGD